MAIDLDGSLLFHMSKGGLKSTQKVLKRGVRAPMLKTSQHQKAFDLIVQQAHDHGTTPTPEDLKGLFGNVVEPTAVDLSFIVTHLHKRREFNELSVLSQAIQKHLEDNDPTAGKMAVLEAHAALKTDPSVGVDPTSIFALGEDVKVQYHLSESGGVEVPLPWDSMNEMCQGLYPGTNSWFVARPGTGKTWLLLVIVLHAWIHGQEKLESGVKPLNILIVSPEMLKAQMAERLFTMIAKVGYGQVVGGKLGAYGKEAFFKVIDDYAKKLGIWILDGSDGITPERIELAVEEVGADVLAIDAAYKIKWDPKSKDRFADMFAGVSIVSNWSKREWADHRKISIVASSQMNRAGDKKDGKNSSAVALSDNLVWEADNLFLLEQDEDMKADKRLRAITEKCRRQAKYVKSVLMRWDMDTMDFTEMPEVKSVAKFKDSPPAWGKKPSHDDY